MGAILMRKKGLIPPQDLVKAILAANSTTLGMALVDVNKVIQTDGGTGHAPLEHVVNAMNQMKAVDMVLHFGSVNDPKEEDVQPFVLLTDDKDRPALVMFAEGDFGNAAKANVPFSGAYQAAMAFKPEVAKLYKFSKGDVNAIMEHYKGADESKEIESLYSNEGTIVLMANTGEILAFNSSKNMHPGEWGWTTDLCGWTPPATSSFKPKSSFSALAGKKPETKMTQPEVKVDKVDPEVTKPDATPPATKPSGGDEGRPRIDDEHVEMRKDPQNDKVWQMRSKSHLTNDQKRSAYIKYAQDGRPNGYKNCPWVLVKDEFLGPLKSFKDLAGQVSADTAPPKSDFKPFTTADKKTFERSMGGKPIASTEPIKQSDLGPIPIMEQKEWDAIQNFLKSGMIQKTLDQHSKDLAEHPERIQELEAKLPTFAQKIGTDMEATFKWPYSIFQDICGMKPKAAAIGWYQTVQALVDAYKELDKLTAPTKTSVAPAEVKPKSSFSQLAKKKSA